MKSKYITIFFWVLLMISAIYIFQKSIEADLSAASIPVTLKKSAYALPKEAGVFKRAYDLTVNQPTEIDPEIERTLTTYYDNRAYNGAPPTIPHEIFNVEGIGAKDCLQCHENGGYVARFNAYTPITPHPELISCKQCHVPKTVPSTFKPHGWVAAKAPQIHNSALPGSPPVIPHDLQMRSNCLACHGGAAAPKEIRVSHPERSNCRQCHVPAAELDALTKNMKQLDGGAAAEWTRTPSE